MAPAQPITAKGYDGTVTFDGWWIDIDRRGGLAGISAKMNRYNSKRIPLSHVEQVVWKRPSTLVNGHLEFVVRSEARPGGSAAAVSASPNTVLVTKQQIAAFEPLHTALLTALARTHPFTGAQPAFTAPPTGNPAPLATTPDRYPRPDRYTGDRGRAAQNQPAESAVRSHLTKLAWVGLVLGTFFAAAAAVDTEIAVFVLAGSLAVLCGWFLISRDHRQDRARPPAGGAPIQPQWPGRPR